MGRGEEERWVGQGEVGGARRGGWDKERWMGQGEMGGARRGGWSSLGG